MGKEKYEEAFAKLEGIVRKMTEGDLPLEEMLKSFEEGIRLARVCARKLDEVERKVQLLIEEDGKVHTKPLKEEEIEGE
jgi:exodeoxyribonuclease VII small subunit